MAKDFDETEWADYLRGLVEPTRRTLMASHLASGCVRCEHTVRWQRELLIAMRRERDYTPPELAVRRARAVFLRHSDSPLAALPRLLARLVSDTALQPLAAGVRSARGAGRHALFEVGDYSVDLRVHEDEATTRVVVVGQVLDRRSLLPGASDPVMLVRGKRVVAHAPVNEFGEFRFECAPERGLTLQVPVDAGTLRVDVPMTDLVTGVRTGPAEIDDA